MTNINDTMYTLGQLARAIYPAGDIPATKLDQLLVYPSKGIALLLNGEPRHTPGVHKVTRQPTADEDELAHIINKLPADMPNGPVGVEHQGPFWAGWYHYLAAVGRAKRLKPADLERAGVVLFGKRWKTDLANALQVNDRRIREWLSGERKPSPGVWADIAALLRQRSNEGMALLAELELL